MHINTSQLDLIERALTLQENWDKALEAVKEVRENVADDVLLEAAREAYQNDDVEIDDDAGTSEHDTGCWVSAWVHLRKPVKDCVECDGTGKIDDVKCEACDGEGEIMLEFGEE